MDSLNINKCSAITQKEMNKSKSSEFLFIRDSRRRITVRIFKLELDNNMLKYNVSDSCTETVNSKSIIQVRIHSTTKF
jgi:hypothetical protein